LNKKQVIFAIVMVFCFTSCIKNNNDENFENILRESTISGKINKHSIQIINSKMQINETDITGYWVPQENDIVKALKILDSYLQYPKNKNDSPDDKNQIINNMSNFDFQIIGILKGKIKYIYLNAFPNSYPKERRDSIIFVLDGGWNYWQSEIDLTNGKIEYFSINGYA